MKKAVLYTWTYCPYCVRAKRLLERKGIEYEEHNIQEDEPKKKELLEETGQDTVPYVFLDGEFIGGYDQLRALNKEGKL